MRPSTVFLTAVGSFTVLLSLACGAAEEESPSGSSVQVLFESNEQARFYCGDVDFEAEDYTAMLDAAAETPFECRVSRWGESTRVEITGTGTVRCVADGEGIDCAFEQTETPPVQPPPIQVVYVLPDDEMRLECSNGYEGTGRIQRFEAPRAALPIGCERSLEGRDFEDRIIDSTTLLCPGIDVPCVEAPAAEGAPPPLPTLLDTPWHNQPWAPECCAVEERGPDGGLVDVYWDDFSEGCQTASPNVDSQYADAAAYLDAHPGHVFSKPQPRRSFYCIPECGEVAPYNQGNNVVAVGRRFIPRAGSCAGARSDALRRCQVSATVADPDPAGLNIRDAPNGKKVVGQVHHGAAVWLGASTDGWVWVTGACDPERPLDNPPSGWVAANLLSVDVDDPMDGALESRATAGYGDGEPLEPTKGLQVRGCHDFFVEVMIDGQRRWVGNDAVVAGTTGGCERGGWGRTR